VSAPPEGKNYMSMSYLITPHPPSLLASINSYSVRRLAGTATLSRSRIFAEAMGKMRNCGMRKIKCGVKNAE